jgi:hypothetical protein
VLAVVVALTVVVSAAGAATHPSGATVAKVDKVVVVVFENKAFGQVMGGGDAPTFDALARRYALLTDYRGVAHPSLPNYLALVSLARHRA